jgi:hypothetical protein
MQPATVMALRELAAPVRAYGPALLGGALDPHAELLALVWGPRFDRLHAEGLLAGRPEVAPGVLRAVMEAADRFDHLCGADQHQVRRLILRHHGRWDNAACPASC